MSGIKDQANLAELRKRLYDRGGETEVEERRVLTPRAVEVSRGWDVVDRVSVSSDNNVDSEAEVDPDPADEVFSATEISAMTKPKKRRYRFFILLISALFFIITVGISSVYLFFGANQISAKNISITMNAPFSVAGGEELPIQVSITNQNAVAIESATLIINYPPGTRSIEENGRELYEERVEVDTIAAGEAKNIPLKAVLFGEENESKEIKASVEYRVVGSNGTFFKEATPVAVQISSSPIVVRIKGLEKISSGQEMEIRVQLQSNAATIQKNVLVSLSYPDNFSFTSAVPETSYGENNWLISELAPESSYEIVLKGQVSGLASEVSEMQVEAGNPQIGNQFIMDSVLAQSKFSYTIEQPFTGVAVVVNGDKDGEVVLAPGEIANVEVQVTNTLDDAIYDMRVELSPRGNLIRDDRLSPERGFYDSDKKTILYEVSGDSSLATIKPGDTRTFSFKVMPDDKQVTASFNVSANIFARRVNESNAAEALVGSALAEIKYSSEATLGSQIGYGDGSFKDTGPVPPVAGVPTTYTVTLVASAGVNDMAGTFVTASFPQYVSWLDKVEGDGKIEFNPVSKQLRWNIGDITAQDSKTVQIQLSLLPSVTQVGDTPIVVGKQELKATDSFTGVTLRSQKESLTNELSTELGFIRGNGIIQPKSGN